MRAPLALLTRSGLPGKIAPGKPAGRLESFAVAAGG